MNDLRMRNVVSVAALCIMCLLAFGSGANSPRQSETGTATTGVNNTNVALNAVQAAANSVAPAANRNTKSTANESECPGELIAKLAIKHTLSNMLDQSIGVDDFDVSAISPTKRKGTCRTTATYQMELNSGATVTRNVTFNLVREKPNVAVPGGLYGWRAIAN